MSPQSPGLGWWRLVWSWGEAEGCTSLGSAPGAEQDAESGDLPLHSESISGLEPGLKERPWLRYAGAVPPGAATRPGFPRSVPLLRNLPGCSMHTAGWTILWPQDHPGCPVSFAPQRWQPCTPAMVEAGNQRDLTWTCLELGKTPSYLNPRTGCRTGSLEKRRPRPSFLFFSFFFVWGT